MDATSPGLITLREVTRDNFHAVRRLRVRDDQHDLVSPNTYSIAEAYVEPTFMPFGLYAGDELVGFAMYGCEDDTGRWWIIRIMIDARFQGRGYGRSAMLALIRLMVERENCREIFISYMPGNHVAERLYGSLGFRKTGQIDDDELVAVLDLSGSAI